MQNGEASTVDGAPPRVPPSPVPARTFLSRGPWAALSAWARCGFHGTLCRRPRAPRGFLPSSLGCGGRCHQGSESQTCGPSDEWAGGGGDHAYVHCAFCLAACALRTRGSLANGERQTTYCTPFLTALRAARTRSEDCADLSWGAVAVTEQWGWDCPRPGTRPPGALLAQGGPVASWQPGRHSSLSSPAP